MKRTIAILLAALMTMLPLSGCRFGGNEDTTGNTQPSTQATQPSTQATQPSTEDTQDDTLGTGESSGAQILSAIWGTYADEERFAAYGGTVEHSVADAPGDLDMNNTEELTTKYLLPMEQLSMVKSAASLVHLMNSNIFTGVVFEVDGSVKELADAIRQNIQKTQWICGQPDQLLMAQVEGHLLMAFGGKDVMDVFRGKLTQVHSGASVLYDEAITA